MKTKNKEPIKEHFKIRVFILMAIIVFYISIRKDCANYDKRHSVYVNEDNLYLNSSERDDLSKKKNRNYFCCVLIYKIPHIMYLHASCVKIRVITLCYSKLNRT
jgi:hypothetical protein